MRNKQFILIAAVAIVTASCAQSFEAKETQQSAIGFGTWAETLTKARTSGATNTSFENGDKFDVYGIKTVSSGNKVVFNGDNVIATVAGSTVTWDYAPHRFWDPAASSYTFYAALPADQLAAETSTDLYATTGQFTSNDITFNDPTAFSNDVLVGKQVVSGTGAAAPYSYSGPVNIQFHHVASCVDLKVKQDKALGDAVVKVTALSLLNISNKGHYAVTAYAADPYSPTVSWTEASSPTTLGTAGVYTVAGSYPVTVGGKTTYSSHAASSTTGTPVDLFTGYVFMPQDLSSGNQKIKISYTIQVGTEEPNVYTDVLIDLKDFQQTDTDNNSGTAITSWAPKTHYIYCLTIGANVITFTANVNDWSETVTGYRYLLQ